MARTHHLDASQVHYEWNNALPPRLAVAPGDTVVFDLKISEIVDAPNWIVSAFLPESIFG